MGWFRGFPNTANLFFEHLFCAMKLFTSLKILYINTSLKWNKMFRRQNQMESKPGIFKPRWWFCINYRTVDKQHWKVACKRYLQVAWFNTAHQYRRLIIHTQISKSRRQSCWLTSLQQNLTIPGNKPFWYILNSLVYSKQPKFKQFSLFQKTFSFQCYDSLTKKLKWQGFYP